jgi:VCBS repeat-containing protein
VDSEIATVSLTVTSVNDAPVASDVALTAAEDNVVAGHLVTATSDVDGDALSIHVVNGPQHGTLTIEVDGSFTYTPNANYNGSDSFSYKLSDGELESSIATVSFTMTAINDAPVVNNASATLSEDGTLTFHPLSNASDVDGDALSVVIVNGPTHGTLERNADGSYRYTPAANYAGGDSITYKVKDGSLDSNVATLVLTVTPVNDVPVAVNDTASTLQDHPLVINVLANDSDIDNSTGANAGSGRAPNAGLSARIVSQPANGTITVNADGTLTYTPKTGYYGTDSFSYVASDGELESALASVTITVIATNKAPVANDDRVDGRQNYAVTFNPLINDTDADGDPLSTVIVAGPAHGTLVRNADGSFTYTPDHNWTGTDTITYQANDGKASSNVATVRLVIAPNLAPVAVDDYVARVRNTKNVTINVVTNDTDAEGNPLTTRLISGPAHGSVVRNNDGTFTYTPQCDYVGADTFRYVVNDGQYDSNVATVTINVVGPNRPPHAVHDTVTTIEDVQVRIDVVANDWDSTNDPLTSYIVKQPKHGTLTLNADGSYTYTPEPNWYGLDGFLYRANDGEYDSNVGTVWIRVTSDGQQAADSYHAGFMLSASVASDSQMSSDRSSSYGSEGLAANEDEAAFVASLEAAAADADEVFYVALGEDVTLYAESLALYQDVVGGELEASTMDVPDGTEAKSTAHTEATHNGRLLHTSNGGFGYSVSVGFLGTDKLHYQPKGNAAASHAADVTVTTLRLGTHSMPERISNGHSTARVVAAPIHGELRFDANGTYTYTPKLGWFGVDAFAYRIKTDNGESGVIVVRVNVTPPGSLEARDAELAVPRNGSVNIDFTALTRGTEGRRLALELGKPNQGVLLQREDGRYTYLPKPGFAGTDTFTYSVTDGQTRASASVTVKTVVPTGAGNSVSVQSVEQVPSIASARPAYIVVNQSKTAPPANARGNSIPNLDWAGVADAYQHQLDGRSWDALIDKSLLDQSDLVAHTGLVVKRKH